MHEPRVETGKAGIEEIKDILRKYRSSMLKSNVLGSDFSFLKRRTTNLVFKIEPMVFYDFLTAKENASLSVTFPMNDFVTSGTWPSIAMVDFERPRGAGREFNNYVDLVFNQLKKRKILVASGHTGGYGNLSYGVAGTMALVGFGSPSFSFKRIRREDSFYSVGRLGSELVFFRNAKRGAKNRSLDTLSIEEYIKELLKLGRSVHYIHDLSEGGLSRGLREVSELCQSGFNVRSARLKEVTAGEAKAFGERVFSASSSGAILVAVDHQGISDFEKAMRRKSCPYMQIERRKRGVTLDNMSVDDRDSITEILS